MGRKLTEVEKLGDQRSKEFHIDASLEEEDTASKSNLRENLEGKQTLEKLTDISGSPASQDPEAGDSTGGGSEKKVAEQVCPDPAQDPDPAQTCPAAAHPPHPDAARDDVVSDGQMSSNKASVGASTEGEILFDASTSLSRS